LEAQVVGVAQAVLVVAGKEQTEIVVRLQVQMELQILAAAVVVVTTV
jgi:hypothetical protein